MVAHQIRPQTSDTHIAHASAPWALLHRRRRLLIQRGKAKMEMLPGDVRHLANALARQGVRVSNGDTSRPQKNPEQWDGFVHR